MNKLKNTISVLCFASLVSAFAASDAPVMSKKSHSHAAAEGAYVRVDGGVALGKYKGLHKSETAPLFGVGAGYKFNDYSRADVTARYSWKHFTVTDAAGAKIKDKSRAFDLFLNGYLDASNDTIFTPYLTAGVGLVHNKLHGAVLTNHVITAGKNKVTRFAGNVGAGVRAELMHNVYADLGYRYLITTKIKKSIPQYKAHEVTVGVAYHF